MTTYLPSLTLPDAVFLSPAASMLVPVILGGITGHSSSPKRNKRASVLNLKQPPGMPPAKVFPIAWTGLYTLMGYAAHRAISAGLSSPVTTGLARRCATVYTLQLGLNMIWMPLFFVARRPIEATGNISALVCLNTYLAYQFGKLDTIAGWCMVPYVAWLSFGTYLSAGAGYLNGWEFKL
ncbi:hypothetical protein TD95_000556 [Thielaviopsis punctulata]|uniref:TspO/MBR-related protein n=1 Tax=Thielaviopsis punctulata TaxID=72032 RepID=A0A0F4ZMU6_9PEZI|nr:hypothetical protein TD95_000556 [Thielaviopsis punctulata]